MNRQQRNKNWQKLKRRRGSFYHLEQVAKNHEGRLRQLEGRAEIQLLADESSDEQLTLLEQKVRAMQAELNALKEKRSVFTAFLQKLMQLFK